MRGAPLWYHKGTIRETVTKRQSLQVGKVFAVLEAVWPPTAQIVERWDFKGHRGTTRTVPQVGNRSGLLLESIFICRVQST